jgi:hypothetical protein
MSKAKHVLAAMIAACAASVAFGQTTGQPPAQQQSGDDAFVKQRNEKKETKTEYKSGQITKQQHDQELAQEKKNLKASGQRGTFEQNLDAPQPAPANKSKK